MKKIALIMDSWNRYFTYAWPSGILQRLRETEEQANLYIFNSSGNWSQDDAYNLGEYNIYRLPKLEEFDGIILDMNNVSQPRIVDEVVERAEKAGVPVISISNDIRDFYYVGIDNYSSMKAMIAHLHECHGCRKYWCIMGERDNYENRQREAALRDYLTEHQLPFSETDFYFESFKYECGVKGFEELLLSHKDKPDAVVCANDNIAVGVCEAAAAHGFRVPDDFCVTGFDNFDKASHFVPRISTVSHIREDVGYLCADVFLRLWAGEAVPRFNYTETKCICWESCGCSAEKWQNDREYLKDQVMYQIETDQFNSSVLTLSYELMQCSTVEEMMYHIPESVPSMRCDAMYLVLDPHMDLYKKQEELCYNASRILPAETFCVEGYPEKMQIKFAYENGRKAEIENMLLDDLFPQFECGRGGTDFLFIPLHFRERTVGYFVIRNAVYLMEKQYLFQVMNALNTALENLHKNEKLEYMNKALSRLYIMDSMTGVYNRRGYQQFFGPFLEDIHRAGGRGLILFIDLDRLKVINDTLGHDYGDYAIIAVAKSIRMYCDEEGMAARTGGDEFVLLQKWDSPERTEELKKNICTELKRHAEQIQFPVELGVSVGAVVSEPFSGKRLEDYVKSADELMYREKVRKKRNRK